jgi:hypothetical protein
VPERKFVELITFELLTAAPFVLVKLPVLELDDPPPEKLLPPPEKLVPPPPPKDEPPPNDEPPPCAKSSAFNHKTDSETRADRRRNRFMS